MPDLENLLREELQREAEKVLAARSTPVPGGPAGVRACSRSRPRLR